MKVALWQVELLVDVRGLGQEFAVGAVSLLVEQTVVLLLDAGVFVDLVDVQTGFGLSMVRIDFDGHLVEEQVFAHEVDVALAVFDFAADLALTELGALAAELAVHGQDRIRAGDHRVRDLNGLAHAVGLTTGLAHGAAHGLIAAVGRLGRVGLRGVVGGRLGQIGLGDIGRSRVGVAGLIGAAAERERRDHQGRNERGHDLVHGRLLLAPSERMCSRSELVALVVSAEMRTKGVHYLCRGLNFRTTLHENCLLNIGVFHTRV